MSEVFIPFAASPLSLLAYLALLVIITIIVIKVTSGMEPIPIYTGEKRVQSDPRLVLDRLKRPLDERGIGYIDAGDRMVVEAVMSYIEVYPITMPSPAVGLKILVKPSGILIAVILLLLGPVGILIDVVGALLVYDRYNRVSRIIEELRL